MLRMYIEEALYLELLDVARAYQRRHYLRIVGQPSRKPVQCPPALYPLVLEFWPDPSITLVSRSRTMDSARKAVHWLRRLKQPRRFAPGALPDVRPAQATIAVELVEGSDPGEKSDVYWLENDAIDPRRVLFIFEPHNRSLLEVERERGSIERLGAQAVALDASVSAEGKIPLWTLPRRFGPGAKYPAALPAARSAFDRWLRRLLLAFTDRLAYWESFFSHFNVAVYQHFSELTLDTAPRRLAIDRRGGIEIGKMRSQFFDRASPAFHFQHEIAMVWNASVGRDLDHARTRTREVVAVGYPWDHLFSRKAAEAKALRQQLAQGGARYVITVYDNYPHLNGHFGRSHVEALYRLLIGLAHEHSQLGLIVKSKKVHVLAMIPEVSRALQALRQAGRCVVIDAMFASIAPSALAADLVVTVPASTAGCEAALGGRRVLMYDPGGCTEHPFCGSEKEIIYTDFEALRRAVVRCLDAPSPASCGDPAPYLPEIDPFRDGRAYRRAAAYINGYLEARDAGLEKPDALGRAKARYQQALTPVDAS